MHSASPSLPVLLRRIAMTQMALAEQLNNTQLINNLKRAELLEESKSIVVDLQAFTDRYIINVIPRRE